MTKVRANMGQTLLHLDADDTIFFEGQLELIKAQTYDTKYAPLKALNGGLIPVSTEAGSGVTEITWRSFSRVGQAKIIADYAHDIPRADIYATETSVKPHLLALSYGYGILEIRRAARAGLALTAKRAEAVRQGIDTKINKIALLGDSDYNLQGFLNYTGMPEYTVTADGTGSSKLWSAKSTTQILRDLNGMVSEIITTTNGVESPNTVLLPTSRYLYIKTLRIGDGSDKTVLSYFLENNPGMRVEWLNELEDLGDGSTARMIAYNNDARNLELHMPNMFEQLETQLQGLEYIVPCIAETAGVTMYYPYSAVFGDGI